MERRPGVSRGVSGGGKSGPGADAQLEDVLGLLGDLRVPAPDHHVHPLRLRELQGGLDRDAGVHVHRPPERNDGGVPLVQQPQLVDRRDGRSHAVDRPVRPVRPGVVPEPELGAARRDAGPQGLGLRPRGGELAGRAVPPQGLVEVDLAALVAVHARGPPDLPRPRVQHLPPGARRGHGEAAGWAEPQDGRARRTGGPRWRAASPAPAQVRHSGSGLHAPSRRRLPSLPRGRGDEARRGEPAPPRLRVAAHPAAPGCRARAPCCVEEPGLSLFSQVASLWRPVSPRSTSSGVDLGLTRLPGCWPGR